MTPNPSRGWRSFAFDRFGLWLALALGTLLLASPPSGAGAIRAVGWKRGDWLQISSVIQVLDGDTLRATVEGKRVDIRLYGIDAPEDRQICTHSVPCGFLATRHLRELLGGVSQPCLSRRLHGECLRRSQPVACEVLDLDRKWKRPVAVCVSAGVDLGKAMVADGFAFPAYSARYRANFIEARREKRGLHARDALRDEDAPAKARAHRRKP